MKTKVSIPLREWLQSNPLSERDQNRLWKGLLVFMYRSDRPSVQEKMAEYLASLIDIFGNFTFFKAFLKIMSEEWLYINYFQMHKFIMLVRRVTRQCFVVLQSNAWNEILFEKLSEHVEKIIFDRSTPTGFITHFTEIFLDELAMATTGKHLRSSLIQAFVKIITIRRDPGRLHKIVGHGHTVKYIFQALLYQRYLKRAQAEKLNAWERTGSSGTSINEADVENKSEAKPAEDIEKINKNKRKKKTTNVDLQPKKLKLSKGEQLKLKKMEFLYNWVEEDLTPEVDPIPINMDNLCKEAWNNIISTDADKENVVTVADSRDPALQEEKQPYIIAKSATSNEPTNQSTSQTAFLSYFMLKLNE